METNHHQESAAGKSSGECLSPTNHHHDPEFEFGSLTLTSPSKDPYSNNSPADRLFLNGRLLPHAFPSSQPVLSSKFIMNNNTASMGSSVRSNSLNSSSSTSTNHTPRTSSSSSSSSNASNVEDGSRFFYRRNASTTNFTYPSSSSRKKATEMVTSQLYGSYSRRWQYITPVPGVVFKRDGSAKKKGGGNVSGSKTGYVRSRSRRNGDSNSSAGSCSNNNNNKVARWWRRLIRAVLMACQECHAMEPSRSRDHDVVAQSKSVTAS